ncbi:MAG: Uma2 family endonuclease [Anaerolineae bacterium]|nr:Uma2 family endonuclease [Anaerolineae bacterium]
MSISMELLERADQAGIRLEMVRGLPIWEASPVVRHQRAIDRIRRSLVAPQVSPLGDDTPCACIDIADIYIRFLDGSLKRPDVSIFCREPDELDEAVTQVPVAVIEVISKGYEAKDIELGPQFYLAQGVQDVIVFNPHTLTVQHFRASETMRWQSPVKIKLECGCVVVI